MIDNYDDDEEEGFVSDLGVNGKNLIWFYHLTLSN